MKKYHQSLPGRLLAAGLMLVLSLAGISACSNSASTAADSGELVVSLTDAEGDFLSYTVDVTSLKLIKQNGAEVETLPMRTTLDFARYVDVSEFLTAATVPSGKYVGAKITLDYSNASITVQDSNGNPITGHPVDSNGDPVQQLTVDLSLNGDSEFVIAPGIPAHFTLDFDLDASNAVTISGADATVVVSPVMVADTILKDPKPHRLRGVLGHVDSDAFRVVMRPFRHRLNRFGSLKVYVDQDTSYEINGEMVASDAGLDQLAQLPAASAVVVKGQLDYDARKFIAAEVYAGSSVPWGNKDIVTGNVISRSGDTLTVRGASVVRADGSFLFNDNMTVNLDSTTTVVKQADASNSYTKDDISVGQRVTVLGHLQPGSATRFDATHIRMLFTDLGATVVNVSPLTLDLQGIDRRRVTLFDFSGTGVDAASDADPMNYDIDSGSLSLANLAIGDPVKVRGFPRPFGQAPEDFTARTIVDVSNLPAHIAVGFGDGSTLAVTSLTEAGLQLNLAVAGDLHTLLRAGIATDLTSLVSMPLIAPRNDGSGLFVVARGSAVRVYSDYAGFQAYLASQLDGTTGVMGVSALGRYNPAGNSLTARKICVRLTD